MNRIELNKKDKTYFVAEIAKVIKTGNDAKLIAKLLEENLELLSDDEYIKIEVRIPRLPDGFYGLLTPGYEYSINLKHTTIIIAALILDLEITSGFASTILNLTGLSFQTIKKLNKEQKCLVAEISLQKGCSREELNFENKECVWNNFECNYLKREGICQRSKQIIESNINELIESKVVIENNGLLKICF